MVKNNKNCHEMDELTSTGGNVEELGNIIFPPKYSSSSVPTSVNGLSIPQVAKAQSF